MSLYGGMNTVQDSNSCLCDLRSDTMTAPNDAMRAAMASAVDGDMEIGREEVFGPVLVIQPYDTEAEALALANGTEYGLCAGVFSQDIDKIGWFADRLIAGQIYVNEWYAGGIETPFGGMNLSGSGSDKGHEAIYNHLQTKNVVIKLSSS